MVLCDIGAGTGIFSFPATQISNKDIYELEISDSMIELLKSRAVERRIQNLKIRKVNSPVLPLDNSTCDMAVMVTVLHEVDEKNFIIKEIKRVLRTMGKLLIIEFHKRSTPMGPPIDHRISEELTQEICNNNVFKIIDKFSSGENFYGIVFEC